MQCGDWAQEGLGRTGRIQHLACSVLVDWKVHSPLRGLEFKRRGRTFRKITSLNLVEGLECMDEEARILLRDPTLLELPLEVVHTKLQVKHPV